MIAADTELFWILTIITAETRSLWILIIIKTETGSFWPTFWILTIITAETNDLDEVLYESYVIVILVLGFVGRHQDAIQNLLVDTWNHRTKCHMDWWQNASILDLHSRYRSYISWVQWSFYFKTTHRTMQVWSYIAGSVKEVQ